MVGFFFRFLVAALLAGVFSTGCQTPPKETSPPWYSHLREEVGTVNELSFEPTPPLETPTNYPDKDRPWAYGQPRKLIDRLSGSETSRPSSNAMTDSPGPGAPGEANAQVVVNIGEQTSPPVDAVYAKRRTPSMLERLYRGNYADDVNRELVQIGYAFFEKEFDNSIRSGPVPQDYLIGVDDEIILTLSGNVRAFHRLEVDRDGQINIPDFGVLPVSGMRFNELNGVIRSFLEEQRTGFDLNVSLGRLRSIQVDVIGNVQSPGRVEISALGSVIDALGSAGGPEKSGTLRSIQRFRSGEVAIVDLYGFLFGNMTEATLMTLQEGDRLVVGPIGATVGVAGFVQRPGIYELLGTSASIADVLAFAGGLTPFSFRPLAQIEKTTEGRGRVRIDVSLEDDLERKMADGELLLIDAVDNRRQPRVQIEGEVGRPGDYEYVRGMTLRDLIERADGLTIGAYLPQVFISRQLGQPAPIGNVVDRTASGTTQRVLVVDLEKALQGNAQHNIKLLPLDLVTVRSVRDSRETATVEVIGAVRRPGTYELTAAMRVSDLIAIAGNLKQNAFLDEGELIRQIFDHESRQMGVRRYRIDLQAVLTGSPTVDDPLLKNGDKLIVRALQDNGVRVRIEGRVPFPGAYVFPDGSRITDLLAAAGGILDDADLGAAVFTRQATRQLQEDRLGDLTERTMRLYEAALEQMIRSGSARESIAAKAALVQTSETLERMRASETDGRIVIPFLRDDFPASAYNLRLESGDRLLIPRRHETVTVAGHVFRPISLVAIEPISVADALDQAGGLTEFADPSLLYVVRADGSVESVAQDPPRLRSSTEMFAGDTLLVPRAPLKRDPVAQLSDLLEIARQAAEIGVLGSQIGRDSSLSVVSPFRPEREIVIDDEIIDDLSD